IAHVRTWTYLSHRAHWIEDTAYWQEKARAIEDSLSDALHEKLTRRFVDRRTSMLMRKLQDDAPLLAGVTEDGEVIVEGQFVGRLLGFEFIVDPRARGTEAKRVRAAAEKALGPVLAARAAALANATAEELDLRDEGDIMWRSSQAARLAKGPAPLRPDIIISGLDALSPHLRGRIKDRLDAFLASRVVALLGELIALGVAVNAGEAGGLSALSRGVAFRLIENFGAMSRAQFGEELKQLDQTERAKLRKLGVRFGEYTLFMPALLKPGPARLLALLWALWTDRQPSKFQPPKAGLVSLHVDRDLPHAYYYASGYRPSGARAVRIDMLERLAGQIRAARNEGELKGGFEASPQLMSLVGCSGEEFESILLSLGYRKHVIKTRRPAPAGANGASASVNPPNEAPVASANGAAAPVVEFESPDEPISEAWALFPGPANAALQAAAEGAPIVVAEATAPASAAHAPATESDDREIMVWRLAPRRPPKPKRPPREKAAAPAGARENAAPKGPREDTRRGKRSPGKAADGDARRQKPAPRPHSLQPQHRKVADPNSPFAVLAGLKDELSRQAGVKKPENSN
ncbi:MAG: hypothetical protein WD076_08595, partial [Parvularculaceae bacterium]